MAKSTTEIEREIRNALDLCAGPARGLWHEMRYLIETLSDKPGHLQRDGRPTNDEQLAQAAGYSSDEVTRHLTALANAGLIEKAGDRWYSSRLVRIDQVHNGGAFRIAWLREAKRRKLKKADGGYDQARAALKREWSKARRRERRKRALRNDGVTYTKCNADVTSPPHPASSLPPDPPLNSIPPPNSLSSGGAEGGGDADVRNGADSGCAGGRLVPAGRREPNTPQGEIVMHFAVLWARKYGRRYPDTPADYVQAKELLARCGGALEDAKRAAERFLADDWPAANGHPFKMIGAEGLKTKYLTDQPANLQSASNGAGVKGKHGHQAKERNGSAGGHAGGAGQFAERSGKLAEISRRKSAG